MHKALSVASLFVAWVALHASRAEAGLYNFAEPEEGRLNAANFSQFRTTLTYLRSIPAPKVDVDNPLRRRHILMAELAPRQLPFAMTTEQKINLSSYLIRTRKINEAIGLLQPLSVQQRDNFLVQSNLAMAYQLLGELSRAKDTLAPALESWPPNWADLPEVQQKSLYQLGWNEGPYSWYRKVETYHVKLLKLRSAEIIRNKNKAGESVDALFDDGKSPLRFVSENGKYEVGQIAAAEKAKLPADALDIVQQLLVWMPDDLRLYWLLAEVYNASADMKATSKEEKQRQQNYLWAAKTIFDELIQMGLRADEFREHREAFRAANISDPNLNPIDPPGPIEPDDVVDRGVDWRTLLIGFGAGMAVTVFSLLQIREIRRRRQARAP